MHALALVFPCMSWVPHVQLFLTHGSASFLVPNLRLLCRFLVSYLWPSFHVEPFSLDIKPTCMQPPIYRHTQSRAGMVLPDLVLLSRSANSQATQDYWVLYPASFLKQRWWSSLHNTWHPITLCRSLVLWTLFVLQCSFVLRQFLLALRRSLLVLWRSSLVPWRSSLVLWRSSLVIWRSSFAFQWASLTLPRSSLGILFHVTRDKV